MNQKSFFRSPTRFWLGPSTPKPGGGGLGGSGGVSSRRLLWALACLLFSAADVFAAPPEDVGARRLQVARDYHRLKAGADRGEPTRVIAKVKHVRKGQPGAKGRSPVVDAARDRLSAKGLRSQQEFHRLGLLVYEVDAGGLDDLIDSGVVETIEEDVPVPPSLTQSTARIRADLARQGGFAGAGQTVVIMDTGIESSHPFLGGMVVEEACFSSNTGQSASLCPGGVGAASGPGAGADCSRTGISGCDHGTHVAGIAAGKNPNMSGVAGGARIISIQVFSKFTNYPGCSGPCILSYSSDQLAALEWVLNDAVTDNIAAINMSLGGGSYVSPCDDDFRKAAIDNLRDAGIATVIAAGNNGSAAAVSSPGCISSAVTVGSTLDNGDSLSFFSNSSPLVDLVAPGSSITSSIVNGAFGVKSGTSMAAPHVAGAFAVMRAANPAASVDSIENVLKDEGAPVLDGRNNLSFPRLDLYPAVVALAGKNPAVLSDILSRILF